MYGSACVSHQLASAPKAPPAAVSVTPSSASLPAAHRARPAAWVQANRNVPVSYSLASSGAPANTPMSSGTTSRATGTAWALDGSGENAPMYAVSRTPQRLVTSAPASGQPAWARRA